MRFNEALGEVIREDRHARGVTMRALASNGHLALGYLSEVERGQKDPSSQILEKIAVGLGRQPYELIIEAGIKMYRETLPEHIPAEVVDWYEKYPDLVK